MLIMTAFPVNRLMAGCPLFIILEKMMMIEKEVDEETTTEVRMMMMDEEKRLGDGSIVCASSEKGKKTIDYRGVGQSCLPRP